MISVPRLLGSTLCPLIRYQISCRGFVLCWVACVVGAASCFNALGVDVTICDRLDEVLPADVPVALATELVCNA